MENQPVSDRSKVVVAFVGSVNSGKSSAINELFAQSLVEVGPAPGVTDDVSMHKFGETLLIVDTPGLYDVEEGVSFKTDCFVNAEADAVVFFVNGAQGVTEQDVIAHAGIRQAGLPVITVCSRIDLIDPSDQISLVLGHAEQKLGAEIIPLSSREKIGIEDLGGEILIISDCIRKERERFMRVELGPVFGLIVKTSLAARFAAWFTNRLMVR